MGVRGHKLNNSIFVLGFAVLLIISVGYLKFHPSPEPSFANTVHDTPIGDFVKYPCLPRIPNSFKNTCVRMYNDTSTDVPSELPCVTLKTRYGSAPICTYAPEIDVYVSGDIRRHGIYEPNLVYKLEAMFREQPQTCYFLI